MNLYLLPCMFAVFLMCKLCLATFRSQLFKDVLDQYEVRVAPFDEKSEAIRLQVFVNLMSIRDVNEKDQSFETSFWLNLLWKDWRLKWNSSNYRGISEIQTTSKNVWMPSSICIFNEMSEKKCFTEEKPTTVFSNGYVMYSTARESVTQCKIDIAKYPYDSQMCSFHVGNLFSDYDYINLDANLSLLFLNHYEQNEQWEVTNTALYLHTVNSERPEYNLLNFDIHIKRKPGYVILSVLLPVVLLSVLNIFCFVLPVDSGEKMGTSMAIFLTFAVFLTIINDTMPKSENIPYFTVYLASQLVFSGVTVIMEAIVLRVSVTTESSQVRSVEKTESKDRNLLMQIAKKVCTQHTASSLDKLFMTIMIIVNVCSLVTMLIKTN